MTTPLTEEEVLAFTQGKRKELVNHLTQGGVPKEKGEQAVLLEALSGMDRAALSVMKIKSEERVGNQHAAAAGIIASLLTMTSSTRPFLVAEGVERAIPMLGAEIPAPQVIEGELDNTPPQMDYETFMSSVSPQA